MTKVPGQPETFTAVSGTSTTPPAVPGKTVTYSVRTAVDGSAWAPHGDDRLPGAARRRKNRRRRRRKNRASR